MKALKELRKNKGWTQQQLAKILSISPSTIGMYEQGRREPDNATLLKIAALFNISTDYLLGKQNDTQPASNTDIISTQSQDTSLPPGAFPINSSNSVLIPVLGSVAAGVPIYAENNIIGYEDIPREWTNGGKEYFALRVKGDSMEPKIFEGDTIIVKKQNYIDNGEIAVVLINGDEATVKQVKKTKEGLMLIGFNAAVYSPTLYTPDEVINLPVEIIGKVMELRRQL